MADRVRITGDDLDAAAVEAVARAGATVELAPAALARMQSAREALLRAVAGGAQVYGVTTGLGPRVVESVDGVDPAELSLRTIRARAVAVGDPLATELVRAAIVVRLNGLCAGGSGAAPGVAQALAGLLNRRVHPRVPSSGSVGAADLCLLAHVGLTVVGEGQAEFHGEWMPSERALSLAGLEPASLGPKDGLALCSSSAVATGTAALALLDAQRALAAAQIAAALSMEGFRANVSPLDPRVVDARPAPGQRWAAEGLTGLLAGGSLLAAGSARRLQDPLSFRCTSQVHGSLHATLEFLERAIEPELNGAADNPLVLADDEQVLSNGNFHVPALALALDAAAIAIAQVASVVSERAARLVTERLSGLPRGLTRGGVGHAGLAVTHKAGQSLTVEIRHLAAPFAVHAMVGADGVEDDSTSAFQSALRVTEQLKRLRLLLAIELVCAAQAVDLAEPERLGAGTCAAYARVRELVAPLDDDRAIGPELERLAGALLDDPRLVGSERAMAEPVGGTG